jgi:hypothetical protein
MRRVGVGVQQADGDREHIGLSEILEYRRQP